MLYSGTSWSASTQNQTGWIKVIARGIGHSRVNELDLLRFIAALSVVFHHYSLNGFAVNFQTITPYPLLTSLFRYGYLGVDLFFMISGFVILMTAANEDLRHFVLSRLTRLYPAFWACCTITFVAILTMGSSEYSATFGQYLINMTMLSGFIGTESIDSVYWSLFTELKFYTLVAIVLLLGRFQQIETVFMVWLAITITLIIYPVWRFQIVLLDGYSANFIAGAAFFFMWSKGVTWIRCLVVVLAWCCALYQSTIDVHEFEIRIRNDLSPYVIAIIVSTFFVIMGLIACRQTGVISRINWIWLGAITYPLYLLHQGLGFMIYNALYTRINPYILFWSLIIGMILLSFLIHVAIEKPIARSMKNTLNRLTDKLRNQDYRKTSADI